MHARRRPVNAWSGVRTGVVRGSSERSGRVTSGPIGRRRGSHGTGAWRCLPCPHRSTEGAHAPAPHRHPRHHRSSHFPSLGLRRSPPTARPSTSSRPPRRASSSSSTVGATAAASGRSATTRGSRRWPVPSRGTWSSGTTSTTGTLSGRYADDHLRRAGIRFSRVGEIIAWGRSDDLLSSADEAVRLWMHSAPHKRQILTDNVYFGAGVATNGHTWKWTVIFITAADRTPPTSRFTPTVAASRRGCTLRWTGLRPAPGQGHGGPPRLRPRATSARGRLAARPHRHDEPLVHQRPALGHGPRVPPAGARQERQHGQVERAAQGPGDVARA